MHFLSCHTRPATEPSLSLSEMWVTSTPRRVAVVVVIEVANDVTGLARLATRLPFAPNIVTTG